MDVFDKHLQRISLDSLRMADAMLGVMDGPSKDEAIANLRRMGWSNQSLRRKLAEFGYPADETSRLLGSQTQAAKRPRILRISGKMLRQAMPVGPFPPDLSLHPDYRPIDTPPGKRYPKGLGATEWRRFRGVRPKDPSKDLITSRVVQVLAREVVEIDEKRYLITYNKKPGPLKKNGEPGTPGILHALNLENNDTDEFVGPEYDRVIGIVEDKARRKGRESTEELNRNVESVQELVQSPKFEHATRDLSVLGGQLARAEKFLSQRIDTLRSMISSLEEKVKRLYETPSDFFERRKEFLQHQLGQTSNESDYLDRLFTRYEDDYPGLLEELRSGRLHLPDFITNPNFRTDLTNLVEQAMAAKDEAERESRPFDIKQWLRIELRPVAVEETPHTTITKSYTEKSLPGSTYAALKGSQKDLEVLTRVHDALLGLQKKMAGLPPGSRGAESLRDSYQGQQVVDDIEKFVNTHLSEFSTRYKSSIVEEIPGASEPGQPPVGQINLRMMNREGGIGNALLVIGMHQLYMVLAEILKKVRPGYIPPPPPPATTTAARTPMLRLARSANGNLQVRLSEAQWHLIGRCAKWL
jgi:hypothetical protein